MTREEASKVIERIKRYKDDEEIPMLECLEYLEAQKVLQEENE